MLGPLLFILYINDICNITSLGKFVLFADDTNIFVAADSKNEVYDMANKILQAVNKYMIVNLLHINVKKCCYPLVPWPIFTVIFTVLLHSNKYFRFFWLSLFDSLK